MKTLSMSASLAFAALLPLCFSASLPVDLNCGGCKGGHTAGSTTGPGAAAGEIVTVTVTSLDGVCVTSVTPVGEYCKSSACVAEVTRTWDGLEPATPVLICTISPQGDRKCSMDGPDSGPAGQGAHSETPTAIPCQDELPEFQFTLESSRGSHTTGMAKCSGCKPQEPGE